MSRWLVLLWISLGSPLPVMATESWIDVPEVSLEELEPAVAQQLGRLREHVVGQASDSSVSAPKLGDALGELGRHYHAYNLLHGALDCYVIAQRLAPEDFRWPYLEGYLHQSAGRLSEAVRSYERALSIFAGVPPALVRLGQAYRGLHRVEEAESALRAALELDPVQAAAYATLGQLYQESGRNAEAVASLTRALELEPGANLLYYPLGLAYRALGDLERAAAALERRGKLGVAPSDPLIDGLADLTTGERVHLIRGRTAFAAGDFAAAAEEFRRASELEPESARARVNLATALAQLGQADLAMRELEVAIRLAPGNATALFNLGALHEQRGEWELAAERFAAAVSYEPDDAETRLRLASAQRRLGDLDPALANYGRAIALNPRLEAAYLGEADVLARLARYEEARNRLEAAYGLMPTSGLIGHGLARLLAACPDGSLRDGPRALELALAVVRAAPSSRHAQTVAMAFAETGRCEEAAAWQAQAVEAQQRVGDTQSARDLETLRAAYLAGPPCRPPVAVGDTPG